MSAGTRVHSSSSVGAAATTILDAWRSTAASNRLRATRPFPKPLPRLAGEEGAQASLGPGPEAVGVVLAQAGEDGDQLVVAVVGKVDGPGEA